MVNHRTIIGKTIGKWRFYPLVNVKYPIEIVDLPSIAIENDHV